MRVHLCSDLHLDTHGAKHVAPADAELIIVGGDLANGDALADGLDVASRLQFDAPVVAIAGNHEWYGLDVVADAGRLAGLLEPWTWLDRSVAEFNGWRVLGCTLWSDFSLYGTPAESAWLAGQAVSDFRAIRHGGRALTPDDLMQLFALDRDWLAAELPAGDPQRTIVVTHFGISPRSIHPKYAGPERAAINPYFHTDLEPLIHQHQPALWLHGHTHMALDYRIGRTRVVCNPLGYGPERETGFRPDLLLDPTG